MKFKGALSGICKYYISHVNLLMNIKVYRGPSVEMAMLPAPHCYLEVKYKEHLFQFILTHPFPNIKS